MSYSSGCESHIIVTSTHIACYCMFTSYDIQPAVIFHIYMIHDLRTETMITFYGCMELPERVYGTADIHCTHSHDP